jgi:hypothetical protein
MGGLVIDIVLAFLFKSTIRAFHFFKSSKWERATALVMDRAVLDPIIGCSSVKLHYKLVSGDHSTEGWDDIPFCMRGSARAYAERLSEHSSVTVRVNPKNPQETRFFEQDQGGRLSAA